MSADQEDSHARRLQEERILVDSAISPEDPMSATGVAIEQEAIPDDEGAIKAGRLAGKSMSQAIWILALPLALTDGQEGLIADSLRAILDKVSHEGLDLCLAHIKAQGPHGSLELMVVYGAHLLAVKEREGLADLCQLLLCEGRPGLLLAASQQAAGAAVSRGGGGGGSVLHQNEGGA